MVEIRVNRGQRVQNRPIGVANVNTGRAQAYSSIAQDRAQMSNQMFDIAREEFAKSGEEQALAVEVINEKGEIDYTPLDKPFLIGTSRDAYKTALRTKYAVALENDVVKEAQRVQLENQSDPDAFNRAFTEYTERTRDLIQDIDPELAGQFQTYATKYNVNTQNKIRIEQFNRETEQTVANGLQSFQRSLGAIRNAIAFGKDPSLYVSEASNTINTLFNDNQLTPSQYNAAQNELTFELRAASLSKETVDADVNQLNALSLFLNEGGVNPKRLDVFSDEKKQTIMEMFADATPESMRKLENTVSQRKTALSAEESAANAFAFAQSAVELGSLIDDTKTNREAVDSYFAQTFGSVEQIAQNPDALQALARSPVVPQRMKMIVENGLKVTDLKAMPNPREFFLNLELGYLATENNRKSFSTETYAEIKFLRNFLQQYGTDQGNLEKGLTEYFSVKTDTDKRNKILDNLRAEDKFENKAFIDDANSVSNSALLNAFIETLAENNEDINRQALRQFAPAALPLVAFGYDDAEAVFKKLYKQNYGKSKFFRVDDRTSKEQLYPPEQMFGSDGAIAFEERVNSLMSKVEPDFELGKDYFLVTNPRSTQSIVEYNIIDANGVQMEAGGEKMTINSRALTGYFEMQRRKRLSTLQEEYENLVNDPRQTWIEKLLDPKAGIGR